jgi:hypothetical protein
VKRFLDTGKLEDLVGRMEEKSLVTLYCKELHTTRAKNKRKSTERWKDNTETIGCLIGKEKKTRNKKRARGKK